uniref:IBH1-like N-terminal domain-containing protein n=1 Tax=Leersia perrieri TaxID=77586 RepID=A0A0D9VM12_9ORYZ
MPSASRAEGGGGGRRFKQALLLNLILGLKKGGVASREMTFHDRKTAIKRAADAALAAARGAAPRWSRSLAADSSSSVAAEPCNNSPATATPPSSRKMICRKIILRRSLLRRRPRKAYGSGGGGVARAMMRKRASLLKEIVPGGRALDMSALIGETLDYAVSLKAQVDAMQLLVKILQEQKKIE